MNIVIGLDLGQARDYSALVVTERLEVFTGRSKRSAFGEEMADLDERHEVRHIERFQLGTPYPAVVDRVSQLMDERELRGTSLLVLDATGVGRAVADLFKDAYRQGRLGDYWPKTVTITGGRETSGLNVPKRELVSRVQSLLQTGRLAIDPALDHAEVLKRELLAFRAKITSKGNDTYEAHREGDHDDLVLALALSCWRAHRHAPPRYVTRFGEVVERWHQFH